MEKRKKDPKSASATIQEPEAKNALNKEDQRQTNVAIFTNTMKTDSPSNDNVPSLNHQHPPTLQWPYLPQQGVEQPPLMPRPFIATQSPLPIVMNQWPQFPHLQQNPSNQQGQPPRNYPHSAAPLWLTQQSGYPFPGLNAQVNFQPFIAVGATDTSWQTPAAVGGGASTTNQAQVPNFCYPVGYTYPGFTGPCDPASWWGQAQQPLCTYAFPGGYFSSPPASLPSCTAPVGQSFQKGVIRPAAKLSNKHQQLWDAQSAENVQLWHAVNHLQSEITDYKNRLVRLEAQVSSLKPAPKEPITQVISGAVLSRQPSKRGRTKRSAASGDALPSGESHPQARGRKPAALKVHQFEKVILNKADDREEAYQTTAAVEQGNSLSNIVTHSGNSVEMNGTKSMMPAFNFQFQQELPNAQICGSIGWPSSIASETVRNELNMGSQGFYSTGSVIRREGKIIPGWSFISDEDASEKLEDTVVGSGKDDDNEENMGDDSSSGAEDITRTKDESAYNMDDGRETASPNWS